FVPGAPAKPEAANFYPAGATKADVEAWLKDLPEAERAAAIGFFTTIRRDAAAASAEPSLTAFLDSRAAAFASNDYYASEVAWMKLDSTIDPTIGPYEVYEDGWFNYKAAFEAFITVRDAAE